VLDAGLFDEQFRYAEDFDLWVRLLKQGTRFAYQKKVLLHRNEHSASLCSDTAILFENALSVIEKIKKAGNLSPEEWTALAMRQAKLRACINLEYARREFWADRFTQAAGQLKEANRFYRSTKLYCAILCIRVSPTLLLRAYTSLRRSTFPRFNIAAAQSSRLSSPS
jgi:GT2 family glycosyltransferase